MRQIVVGNLSDSGSTPRPGRVVAGVAKDGSVVRALQYVGAGKVEIVETPLPEPSEGEVLLRVLASALCGSEKRPLQDGISGVLGNLGHEAVGVIEHPMGSDHEIGARVGVSALAGCSACPACGAGREMLCHKGVRIQTGLHAEYAAVAASSLRDLPTDLPLGVAPLVTGDALGVPVRALNRVASLSGDRVLVIGLGPVGLSHVLVRAHAGAEVIAVEPSQYRRDLALRLGAAIAMDPEDDIPPAPLVIECTGVPAVIAAAFERCEPRGTVLQSGECASVTIHPSRDVIHREIAYLGTWFYGREDYPAMLRLVEEGLDVGALVTHRVLATEAQGAIDDFLAGQAGKVVLRWVDDRGLGTTKDGPGGESLTPAGQ